MRDREALEAAGITTAEDALDRPAGDASWAVPLHLGIDQETLLWWNKRSFPTSIESKAGVVHSGPGMLEDFTRLVAADGDDVLRFARRWGVLGICAAHGQPTPVGGELRPEGQWHLDGGSSDVHRCRVSGGLDTPFIEPLGRWRMYAQQAESILSISARLSPRHASRVEDRSLWAPLDELFSFSLINVLELSDCDAAMERRLVAQAVQEWLDAGNTEVRFAWRDYRPHLDVGGGSLFAGLALQLSLAVARVDGLALCDECGRPFIPRRRNQSGPRRCSDPECRKRAPQRRWARARRASEQEHERPRKR